MLSLLFVTMLAQAVLPGGGGGSAPSGADAARGANAGPSCAPGRIPGPSNAFASAIDAAAGVGFRPGGRIGIPAGTVSVAPSADFLSSLFADKTLPAPQAIWTATLLGPPSSSDADAMPVEVGLEEWIYASEADTRKAQDALTAASAKPELHATWFASPASWWTKGTSLFVIDTRSEAWRGQMGAVKNAILGTKSK